MLSSFPKRISNNAIGIYFLSLAVVSLLFIKYAMRPSFMVLGAIWVVGFFFFSAECSRSWGKIDKALFIQNILLTAVAIRITWVVFSYFFYIDLTGAPFEPGAADSLGYHGEAKWMSEREWSAVFDYFFNRAGVSDSGYGLYLTTIYKIFGTGVIVPRIIKAILSSVSCILIYQLASRCINEQAGRMAGIFCMFMPNLIIYCGLHLKETEMLFLLTAFLERADYLLRSKKYTVITIIVPLLLAVSLFLFRTVLGAVAVFSLITSLLFTSTRIVGKAKKASVIVWIVLGAALLAGGTIATEVEGYFEERTENQNARRMQQTMRGNQWAQYATGAVLAPMMFVMPFSTMVDVDQQYSQQILHGGNYVRNLMGFFVILAVILALFVNKDWRNLSLVGSYVIGYLGILATSGFANSERFLLPALPGLIVMWSYGVTYLNRKSFKWFKYWLVVAFLMQFGWAFFKLGSRGLF